MKSILRGWTADVVSCPHGKLDMLVNNVTQTLTDPISAKQTIQNKVKWQTLLGDANSAIENGCQAPVTGD